MLKHIFALLTSIAFATTPLNAGELDAETQRKLLTKVADSLVRIEYRVKYDKGDAPTALNLAQRCESCGTVHSEQDLSDYVKEERPIVTPGFLLKEDMVIGKDLLIHPRFIESISVVHADDRVTAHPAAVASDRPATQFTLERPLKNAKPAATTTNPKPPFYAISYAQKDGRWHARLREFTPATSVRDDGRWACPLAAEQLVVDEAGNAVTVTFNDAGDDAWKEPPSTWPVVKAADLLDRLQSFDAATSEGIIRVALSFRSPRKTENTYSSSSDEEDAATEQNAVGIVLSPRRVLVLSNLKPKATARLKRAVIHRPDGETVKARFEATLRDYGAFIVATETDLPSPVSVLKDDIESLAHRLLLFAKIEMKGENRVAYHQHGRISEFSRRWGNRLFPTIGDDEGSWCIFTSEGALACLSIPRRQKVSVEEQWSEDETVLLPADGLAEIIADLARHADPSNVPLSEAEENRIAWLGVEMQALNAELARANKVSDRTRDGEIGGMVSHVYPGSPAAAAGIEPGDILLSLHVEGEPKPIDITAEEDDYGGDFPWEQWDELPEQYFDSISAPWPSADGALAQALTRLGFGRPFELELFRDGNVKRLAMTVTQSPPHHGSAGRHKNKALGITVRNLTYEVNRYFQRTADEPGLIISKIETGSKASVAGLKPYEIITHVNDEPVHTVKEFKARVKDQESLRLAVKRMTKGRIVRITLERKPRDRTGAAGESARISLAREAGPISQMIELFKFQCDVLPTRLRDLVERPTDPAVAKNAAGLSDPWGNEFNYRAPAEKSLYDFDLWSAGPNGISGDEDDITNWPDDRELDNEARGERAKAAVAHAGPISQQIDLFRFLCDVYPTKLKDLVEKPNDPNVADKWKEPYLKSARFLDDPWGNEYHFRAPGEKNKNGFDLWSAGPNGISGDGDDITNW